MMASRPHRTHDETADRRAIIRFKQIPNVGPNTADDFRVLGVASPQALIG